MAKLLEIQDLSFATGASQRPLQVSAALERGGVINVCGPSGSGKTTLLRILAKLKDVGPGRVLFLGQDWTGFSPDRWRRKVHYLAQKPAIFDGTVRENLMKPFELAAVKNDLQFDLAKAHNLMERVFLPQELLDQDARTLSGGESARMALVRALLAEPSVLLLDEPLAALDHKTAEAVLKLLAGWLSGGAERGAVMVSHVGEFACFPSVSVVELAGREGDLVE